jgi:aspartyl-tRNA(Asn)/glutamyl-tRNA(Gln) amidotransferase subunit A
VAFSPPEQTQAYSLWGGNIGSGIPEDQVSSTGVEAGFNAEMEEIDALLTPSTETAAILLRDVDEEQPPSRFTRFVNLLELCALALPNGFDEAGLPLSLQIVCRGYDEVMALRIGHCYQQATDWHRRVPPLT